MAFPNNFDAKFKPPKHHPDKLRNYKIYFTPKRILFKSSSILNKSAHKYVTVPYKSIAAFEIQTDGGALDADVEMTIWCKQNGELQFISKDFKKDKCDLF